MYKYGKSCIKKLLCFLAICIAILAISFGVMWGLSTDYKIYGVPVLNYHQVNDEKHSALTLHVDQFREQMEYLHNQGYNTITLNQLYDYLEMVLNYRISQLLLPLMMAMLITTIMHCLF